MDKKYLLKMLLINSAWILWIALSVFFGYLIADAYFPENMATFIPFSLIFLVFGGGVSFAVYRIFFKKNKSARKSGKEEGDAVKHIGTAVSSQAETESYGADKKAETVVGEDNEKAAHDENIVEVDCKSACDNEAKQHFGENNGAEGR